MSNTFTFTLTLKSHQSGRAGFSKDTNTLPIPLIKYGETLAIVLSKLNKYRIPENQINHVFNSLGQEIDKSLWTMKITDNFVLYVDTKPTLVR
jgi:hypothetical protein